jgi:uncharacterized protein YkwD
MVIRAGVSVLLFLTAVMCVLPQVASAQSGDEGEILDLINRERSRSRLQPLEWNEKAAKVARSFSRQMAREGFFDHYDRSGRTVTERAADSRLSGWTRIGENLFLCDDNPEFTQLSVRGWMRSSSHRKNILGRNWRATGIGIARSRDDRIYITQVFIG